MTDHGRHDRRVKVIATVGDDGEHHARTGFMPEPGSRRQYQLAIHRRDGRFHLGRRFRGEPKFTRFMVAELSTLQCIRDLAIGGGGTAWVSDCGEDFSVTVEVDGAGCVRVRRVDRLESWAEFDSLEWHGLLALLEWVESTYRSPI